MNNDEVKINADNPDVSGNSEQNSNEYVYVEQRTAQPNPDSYRVAYGNNFGAGFERPAPKRRSNVSVVILTALITVIICLSIGVVFFCWYIPTAKNAYNEIEQTQAPEQTAKATPESTPSNGLVIGNNTVSEPDNVIANCMKTVVSINVEVVQQSYFGNNVATGAGSGVILTSDGYIVTCNHVVEGANNIFVTLQDGTKYEASVVGYDSRTDLAVIKVEASSLPAASIGSSDAYSVGDRVYAIGNPLGELATTVTNGIISGIDRSVEIDGVSMTLMQTDAAINPGNSGGGLFSAETGELLGIVNAKNYGTEIEGLGFAIPTSAAHDIIVELMDKGYVSGRPYLGVYMETVSTSGGQGFFGFGTVTYYARVKAVIENSPAEAAGIQAGDLILAVGEIEISTSDDINAALDNFNAGDTVAIKIQRNNRTMELSVVLGERSGN